MSEHSQRPGLAISPRVEAAVVVVSTGRLLKMKQQEVLSGSSSMCSQNMSGGCVVVSGQSMRGLGSCWLCSAQVPTSTEG